MSGTRTERAQSLIRADGKRRLAAAKGDTTDEVTMGQRERVRWAMGLGVVCAGGGVGAVFGGVIIGTGGGSSTLGGGTAVGGGTTLGGGAACAEGIVGEGGAWGRGRAAGSSLVFQPVKRSRSLVMASSCSWWAETVASLSAQERKLRAWTIVSSDVTSG